MGDVLRDRPPASMGGVSGGKGSASVPVWGDVQLAVDTTGGSTYDAAQQVCMRDSAIAHQPAEGRTLPFSPGPAYQRHT